jgi:ComF family protein
VLAIRCELCGAPTAATDTLLCEHCAGDLPHVGTACVRCAMPLTTPGVCGRCMRADAPISRTIATCEYRFPIDTLVRRLKFRGQIHLARTAAALLAGAVTRQPPLQIDWLLPMPLHPRRLRDRGFNQALEIARYLERHLGIPIASRCCRRARDTAPQTQLSERARQTNMRGAFVLARPPPASSIAIVDDVVTTGASARELARTLLSGGAVRIELWVLARANLST